MPGRSSKENIANEAYAIEINQITIITMTDFEEINQITMITMIDFEVVINTLYRSGWLILRYRSKLMNVSVLIDADSAN